MPWIGTNALDMNVSGRKMMNPVGCAELERAQANLTEAEIQAEHERYYKWFKGSGHYPHITRLMESGVDPDDPGTREER